MTVNATDSFVYREGNGVTTTFPFAFRADSEETVLVELIFADGSTRPLLSSEYAVTLDDIGGSITTQLPEPVAVGQRLYIWRDTTIEQEVSVGRQTSYNPAVVESVWDRLTMSLQELAGKLKLTMSLPPGSDATTAIAQVLEARAEAEAAALEADNSAVAAAQSADNAAAAENSLLEWKGAWVTSTVYEPSDIVREAGSSYVCVIAHTSDIFATDLSAGRWQMFAQQGAAGPGSGDMLAANNLSDLADAPTARSNLGLGTLATVSPTGTADSTTRLAGDGTWQPDLANAIAAGDPGAPRIVDAALDSTVTSAGATWVSERMAAQGHGEIGTLCFAAASGTAAYAIGATIAGSSLNTASAGAAGGSTRAGTWRSLGHVVASSTGQNRVTLWQRVA